MTTKKKKKKKKKEKKRKRMNSERCALALWLYTRRDVCVLRAFGTDLKREREREVASRARDGESPSWFLEEVQFWAL